MCFDHFPMSPRAPVSMKPPHPPGNPKKAAVHAPWSLVGPQVSFAPAVQVSTPALPPVQCQLQRLPHLLCLVEDVVAGQLYQALKLEGL